MKLGQYGLSQAAVGIQAVGLHIVKMDFLEAADLGQQGGVGILLGTHLVVRKERVEQAAFTVLGIEALHRCSHSFHIVGPRGPSSHRAAHRRDVAWMQSHVGEPLQFYQWLKYLTMSLLVGK